MRLSRIVYFSENRIEPAARAAQLADLRRVAVSRNRRRHITGALVYDDRWFAQALEGEIQFVEKTLDRILRDARHANVTIVSNAIVPERLFARWSMGFAERTLQSEPLFGVHWFSDARNPSIMSERSLLKLMVELDRQGFMGSAPNLVERAPQPSLSH
ncbi:MAG: BLUF domain-containing protein [Roseiarcus sp.]|jgi:FAD-dependent sensor of blue light